MGEFVDDIRAALVMNPNFCRLRYKKEEVPKKNGYTRREEAVVVPENTVICSNVSVQDANGNVCLQMKELGSHRKVTFKDEAKRQPLRRRASDIEIRDALRVSARKQNCLKCSPGEFRYGDQSKILKRCLLEPTEERIDSDSVEDMDIERDSKCSSSSSQSKNSRCDVEVQASETIPETSSDFYKDRPLDLVTSESSLSRHGSDLISLDDILARYSAILDETSLQMLQKSSELPDRMKNSKKKPFTFFFFFAFILTPTLLFYFLAFLYFFQPEPLYSVLLRNLKLKDDPQLSPLSTFYEFIKWASWELYDFTWEKLEELVCVSVENCFHECVDRIE